MEHRTDEPTGVTEVQGLLEGPGECAVCGCWAEQRALIAIVQGNSGPGWSRCGCLPCVHARAAYRSAPEWLRKDAARLRAAGL